MAWRATQTSNAIRACSFIWEVRFLFELAQCANVQLKQSLRCLLCTVEMGL